MNTVKLIEQCISSGLFEVDWNNAFFSWSRGCDRCSEGLGNLVYTIKAYATLEEAQKNPDNYYEFQLCGDCIHNLYYGK